MQLFGIWTDLNLCLEDGNSLPEEVVGITCLVL